MKSIKVMKLILAVVCTVLVGCNMSSNGDPVVMVEDSNADMNAATETARNTFQHFLDNWESMPNGASIKFGVPTPDDSMEHIWFKPTEITETEVTGSCGNDPVNVPGLKFGDVKTFKRSELTDWMILSGNKCYGGYTIRVLAELEPENAPPIAFTDFEGNAK